MGLNTVSSAPRFGSVYQAQNLDKHISSGHLLRETLREYTGQLYDRQLEGPETDIFGITGSRMVQKEPGFKMEEGDEVFFVVNDAMDEVLEAAFSRFPRQHQYSKLLNVDSKEAYNRIKQSFKEVFQFRADASLKKEEYTGEYWERTDFRLTEGDGSSKEKGLSQIATEGKIRKFTSI